MNKALFDTDILSEIGKAKDATVAANTKTYRRSFGHFTFSTVSVMEVVNGFQKTQAAGRLHAFLATLPHMEILPFDQAAAELAGRIGGDLERIGQPIGVADTMIAAIAIENGLELVHGGRGHAHGGRLWRNSASSPRWHADRRLTLPDFPTWVT